MVARVAKRNDEAGAVGDRSAAGAATMGARLQAAREKQGLSQQQCAERLYVESRVIAALESEQFATLGGGVYARGHLRRYVALLGEDPGEFEQLMLRSAGASAVPDIGSISTRPLTQPARAPHIGIWPVAVLVVILALAAVVRWAVTTTRATAPATTTVTVPVDPAPPAAGGSP
jgi:cytoskeletal protein RodZ